MAATVKPIEAKSIHQIQSGQVIVDLCSVVKELVENSLDAGANTIEVRFKNNGLDEIEVQDNGAGIAPINYDNVALKHYTSKLSTYSDLSTLQTFGFRGEALSSLCALSIFTVTTALIDEAPKGHRLEFEMSGKLKGTSVVACQKGTTASVQNLFEKLPVRRKELTKNIKREYGKVLGLLHAYACISVNVKFTIKNAMPKGKGMTVFATKANATTRENIANVYGAKTLSALVALDLDLNFEPSLAQTNRHEPNLKKVTIRGHISRPVFGEGRQTPDRQMFFVNGRPCGLPQVAKAINEVYKSFNVSQSPFIFADLQMDTNTYDVNVSPDKRTILLHDATALVESLKTSLNELFEDQDQTVPQSHVTTAKLPAFRPLHVQREASTISSSRSPSAEVPEVGRSELKSLELNNHGDHETGQPPNKLLHDHFRNIASTREETHSLPKSERGLANTVKDRERRASKIAKLLAKQPQEKGGSDESDDVPEDCDIEIKQVLGAEDIRVRDFNARIAEQQIHSHSHSEDERSQTPLFEPPIRSISNTLQHEKSGIVPLTHDRKRPRRLEPEVATITIGDRTVTRIIGSQAAQNLSLDLPRTIQPLHIKPATSSKGNFAERLHKYSALGTDPAFQSENDKDDIDDDASEEGEQSTAEEAGLGRLEYNFNDQSLNTDGNGNKRHVHAPSPEMDNSVDDDDESDYADEKDARLAEETRVAELIRKAEGAAQEQSKRIERRAAQALKGSRSKDAVSSWMVEIGFDMNGIELDAHTYRTVNAHERHEGDIRHDEIDESADSAEEQLSLTVAKTDFMKMQIVGQFNLGFILAVRRKDDDGSGAGHGDGDELFIIDQHASDEKYNFERLQAETVVGNQRLVRPALLDLSAVEEEIVINNTTALEKNGFVVDVDDTGEQDVGRRCQLMSLPLSKEVVFGTKDLDELIHLLAESPMLNDASPVPRPSKVRKMFAMRACRSSVMIGRTLSQKQMTAIIRHMGSIDKPWNCPHGRPTMRHLASLAKLEPRLWIEGDGVCAGGSFRSPGSKSESKTWANYGNT